MDHCWKSATDKTIKWFHVCGVTFQALTHFFVNTNYFDLLKNSQHGLSGSWITS